MRDIKFRALTEQTGDWFHWQIDSFAGPRDIREDVEWETVGQFTGLKDRAGADIYEGDIVRNHEGPNIYTFAVVCEEGVFGDRVTQFQIDTLRDLQPDAYLEVIGNIHQHPELLTQGEK